MTEFLIGSGVCVRIHEDPVELFAICLFSVTADPTCDTPRKKEMETKYPGKWREKQRTRPICFVSRNRKHPGRQGGTFIVSWKRNTRKIRFVSYVSFSLCFDFDPNCALRIARTQSFTVAAFSTLIEAISISSAAEVRLRIS